MISSIRQQYHTITTTTPSPSPSSPHCYCNLYDISLATLFINSERRFVRFRIVLQQSIQSITTRTRIQTHTTINHGCSFSVLSSRSHHHHHYYYPIIVMVPPPRLHHPCCYHCHTIITITTITNTTILTKCLFCLFVSFPVPSLFNTMLYYPQHHVRIINKRKYKYCTSFCCIDPHLFILYVHTHTLIRLFVLLTLFHIAFHFHARY